MTSATRLQGVRVGAMGLLLAGCGATGEQQLEPVETVGRQIGGTEYYVATSGDDSNPGTLALPWRTVQRAIGGVKPGDVVNIRGGTYREAVNCWVSGTAASPITLQSYNGESATISGSDVVTNWTLHSGSIYKVSNWRTDSQQVFVNGVPLRQIGQPTHYVPIEYDRPLGGANAGVAQMQANSFYYDAKSQNLYVWLPGNANPNSHFMEASLRPWAIIIGGSHVNLNKLKFRHSNSGGEAGTRYLAMVELGSFCRMIECDVQWADFGGVSVGWRQTGATVERSIVMNNGNGGIQGAETVWFEVRGNRIAYNNYRGFNGGWHGGGIKVIPNSAGMIESNEIDHNPGMGIWFDTCKSATKFYARNNYVHHNGVGIHVEISHNGAITNNIVANNADRGIYLSATDDVLVANNTIVGTGGWTALEVAGMPRPGHTLRNNHILNNIVANNRSVQDFYMYMPQADISGNTSDHNLFYRAGGSPILTAQAYFVDGAGQHWTGTAYYDLPSFRGASGWDQHSVIGDPRFITADGTEYAIDQSSPAFNAGSTNFFWDTTFDFTWLPRLPAGPYDIGAYEAR
jgi:parallel beta-helix repeat protein